MCFQGTIVSMNCSSALNSGNGHADITVNKHDSDTPG